MHPKILSKRLCLAPDCTKLSSRLKTFHGGQSLYPHNRVPPLIFREKQLWPLTPLMLFLCSLLMVLLPTLAVLLTETARAWSWRGTAGDGSGGWAVLPRWAVQDARAYPSWPHGICTVLHRPLFRGTWSGWSEYKFSNVCPRLSVSCPCSVFVSCVSNCDFIKLVSPWSLWLSRLTGQWTTVHLSLSLYLPSLSLTATKGGW